MKIGDKFVHAHQIDGSRKGGTAKPVVMRVTAMRRGTMYYTRADNSTNKGAWRVDLSKLETVVGGWVDCFDK